MNILEIVPIMSFWKCLRYNLNSAIIHNIKVIIIKSKVKYQFCRKESHVEIKIKYIYKYMPKKLATILLTTLCYPKTWKLRTLQTKHYNSYFQCCTRNLSHCEICIAYIRRLTFSWGAKLKGSAHQLRMHTCPKVGTQRLQWIR